MTFDYIPGTHTPGDKCNGVHRMRPGDTYECGHGIGCEECPPPVTHDAPVTRTGARVPETDINGETERRR